MIVRTMLPEEAEAVGELRIGAYQAQGLLGSDYADSLRVLGRGGRGTVLVAVGDDSPRAPGGGSGSRGADDPESGPGFGSSTGSGPGPGRPSGSGGRLLGT
ncbi:MAG: hypothetical protein J2P26_01225, partial [Nocardiopsaceae bacterium]|nr:hypothetical protein [Nocardiopsaceae bacterium]